MAVPYTFATATGSLPLSQLDSNFSTAITIGNTSVVLGDTITTVNNLSLANVAITSVATQFPNGYLANSNVIVGTTTLTLGSTVSTISGLTLSNVTISSGNVTISNVTTTNVSATTANISGTANVSTLAVVINATIGGNATVTGNVGIGTSSPAGNLQISGSGDRSLLVTGGISGTVSVQLGDSAAAGQGGMSYDNAVDALFLKSAGSERMRIDSSGNVGIGGISTINAKLEIATNNNAGLALNTLRFTDTDTAINLGQEIGSVEFYTSDATNVGVASKIMAVSEGSSGVLGLTFSTGSSASITERMRIDSSGNVGLGGVTPAAWGSSFKALQINYSAIWGNPANTTIRFSTNTYNNGTNFIYLTSNFATYYAQDSGTHAWFNAPSGTAATTATFTQAMTLDASGRLGIGVTSPTRTLDISAASATVFLVSSTGTNRAYYAASNTGGGVYLGRESSTGSTFGTTAYASAVWSEGAYPLVFATNDNERAQIDAGGNLQMQDGAVMPYAPTPVSLNVAATLTNANIQTQIINTTGTTFTLTMPLGTTLETLATWAYTNSGYDFYVVNTASGTITIAVNTGVTSLGGLTIATGVSAQFRIRRTAANTFVLYRLG